MKMDLHVTIERSKLDEAMNKVEEAVCVEWFNGDRDAYEEWAGDRVTNVMWDFLDTLESKCHIQIEPCEDKYFDIAYGSDEEE